MIEWSASVSRGSVMKETNYRHYLLVLLLLISAFNSVDRYVLGLIGQNLETDLSLSDSQLGMLSGIAFAFFFSLMGIPIARWSDRGDRVLIIAVTTLLWSVALALSGLATNFLQFFLLRINVAVGEAGCFPASSSLLSEYFNRDERPRALARYLLGGSLGLVIGYLFGGWLNEYLGWRLTFALVGAPGAALGVLAWLTLREPRRLRGIQSLEPLEDGRSAASDPEKGMPTAPQPSLRSVCAVLARNRTFGHLLICFAVITFTGTGVAQWLPVFFVRRYGLATGELGTWMAIVYGSTYAFGTYWGGELASRYAANNESLQIRMMAWTYVISGLLATAVYLAPNHQLAFALLGASAIFSAMSTGPLLAVIQAIVPDRMRAQSTALVFLSANLIGLGLGPWAVGALSDGLHPWAGDGALRYALLAMCPTYLWSAWHLYLSAGTVAHDMHAVDAEQKRTEVEAIPASERTRAHYVLPHE